MQRLLELLADGNLHSGSELAATLGMSRSAVWKQIHQLESLGLVFGAAAGQGYQLEAPLELLDGTVIRDGVRERDAAVELECLWAAESTSSLLLAAEPPVAGRANACIAEYQSAGRGRRGRAWLAPAGHGVSLSVAWRFTESPANLSCLGLAVGVAALRAVRSIGAADVQLKWPNDLVLGGRKLSGILIDVQGEAGGPLTVVAGVGVNWRLNDAMRTGIADSGGVAPAAMTDCATLTAGRNSLAVALIVEVAKVLRQFAQDGFASLADEWLAADYLAGRTLDVVGDTGTISGIARGIAPDGRLRVDCDGVERLLVSGDVSVRATE